ncbi:hypothetical protein DFH09DRAFT_1164520 [Mycena vulgaris]|nr:hypothetical protein DFH09DRAFT_1164520 [Mycena vulgaris]
MPHTFSDLHSEMHFPSKFAGIFIMLATSTGAGVVPGPERAVRGNVLERLQARGLFAASRRAPQAATPQHFARANVNGTNACIQSALDWMLFTVMDNESPTGPPPTTETQFAFFQSCMQEVVDWEAAKKVAGDVTVEPYLGDTVDWAMAKISTFLDYDGPGGISPSASSASADTSAVSIPT